MTPTRTTARTAWTSCGCAVVVLLLTACSQPRATTEASEAQVEVARLQRVTTMLERQLELARAKDFYLVLDPSVPDLALMLRGAELQRYPVLGISVGRQRLAWSVRADDRQWRGIIWSGGALQPPRPEDRVVVEEPTGEQDDEATPPAVPPTAEERLPVPSRYLVRFSDGLSMEVRPREADADAASWTRARAWWTAKWQDVAAAVRRSESDAVRVRVMLKPGDADSLYRALPPDVSLLVLDNQ